MVHGYYRIAGGDRCFGYIPGKPSQSPLLARRGVCGEAADGVVVQLHKEALEHSVLNLVIDPPPRRFAPPLLARRGDGWESPPSATMLSWPK